MRILLAEDDRLLGSGLQTGLRQAGFQVDWVRDGQAAQKEIEDEEYDAVVLDLGLPLKDGLDVLRQTRKRGKALPVLVLTARDAVAQRIQGLDSGADDYVIKPVDCAPRPWTTSPDPTGCRSRAVPCHPDRDVSWQAGGSIYARV
jgi:two-component system OmpR family response regulator/two-component system response regulator QseB